MFTRDLSCNPGCVKCITFGVDLRAAYRTNFGGSEKSARQRYAERPFATALRNLDDTPFATRSMDRPAGPHHRLEPQLVGDEGGDARQRTVHLQHHALRDRHTGVVRVDERIRELADIVAALKRGSYFRGHWKGICVHSNSPDWRK